MNTLLKSIIRQLPPFLMLGIAIALIISMLIFFSYVLLWGLFVGGILWVLMAVKQYISSLLSADKKKPCSIQTQGRIIEHSHHKEDD